jgi:DNA-3-methyladenine glycosylase
VYFIYGRYYCVNSVCQPEGMAEAVLIRAIKPEFGIGPMRLSRPGRPDFQLTSGPGKLCQALEITRRDNGLDFCDPDSPLMIAQNPQVRAFRRSHGPVRVSPRIGLTQAATLPLRFYLGGKD